VRQVLIASLAVTAALWLAMAGARAGIGDPHGIGIFRHLLFFQDFHAAPLYALVLVAALVPAVQRAGMTLAALCSRQVVPVAILTTLALALGSHLVYHAHPLSMDEYAPVFQSAAFAEGRLAGQFPPDLAPWLIARHFVDWFFKLAATGEVASSYWPGFALLLTPFTALGASWLLNPVLGGATVLVMHRLARELLGGEEWAGLVVLLTLASPAVTINALSFYSMPAHLLANACFALLLLRPSAPRAALAGLVGSFALVLHNPLPHLLFALPWFVWLAAQENRFRLLAALAAGYVPLSLLLGFGWTWYLRSLGSPLSVADVAAQAGSANMAWSILSGALVLPTPEMLVDRLWGVCKIWLWSSPAIVVLAVSGFAMLRGSGIWRVLGGCALLNLVVYLFVPFNQGHGWGFRYFHPVWLVLPLFAVAALAFSGGKPGSSRLAGYLAACALLSIVLMTGLRAAQVEHFIASHLAQVPIAAAGSPRVTIIEQRGGYYSADLVQNDPFLRNLPLMLASMDPQRDELMMARLFPRFALLHKDRRGSVWGLR
jgi:hypothetical protein